MQRSARQAKKQRAKLEKEAPKAKKSRSTQRIPNIVTLDNGTMVEAFKYLNYCQLAKNSLVSKRFLNVICTHRPNLALLYVNSISLVRMYAEPVAIKIFNKELSSEEYDEWVSRNNYLKPISFKHQVAINGPGCQLSAYGNYKDTNQQNTSVFYARFKQVNHETWPLFQHFVRLLTDPSIYIRYMELTSQVHTFYLLAATIDSSNRGRVQCNKIKFDFDSNSQKFFNWIRDHVRCVKFRVGVSNTSAYRDKQLLDFFATGSHCTSKIVLKYSQISKVVVVDLVQKFMDLKNIDEYMFVRTIKSDIMEKVEKFVNFLKRKYTDFIVKEERDDRGNTYTFEFVNHNIGKKLQLTTQILDVPYGYLCFYFCESIVLKVK